MKKIFPLIAFAVFSIVGSVATKADVANEVFIGSVKISLPIPRGYCLLRDSNDDEQKWLNFRRKLNTNQILAAHAWCDDLALWKQSKLSIMERYDEYQTPNGESTQSLEEICSDLRAQGEKYAADSKNDSNERAAALSKQLRTNEKRFLGVLSEDRTSCHFGVLNNFTNTNGASSIELIIGSIAAIKGKLLFQYFHAPYQSTNTNELLVTAKENIAKVIGANR